MESKLEFSDTLTPRTNWPRIIVAVSISLAIAGLLAVGCMALSGCEPRPVRSIDGSELALMWLLLMVGYGALFVAKRRRQRIKERTP